MSLPLYLDSNGSIMKSTHANLDSELEKVLITKNPLIDFGQSGADSTGLLEITLANTSAFDIGDLLKVSDGQRDYKVQIREIKHYPDRMIMVGNINNMNPKNTVVIENIGKDEEIKGKDWKLKRIIRLK